MEGQIQTGKFCVWSLRDGERSTNLHNTNWATYPSGSLELMFGEGMDRARLTEGMQDVGPLTDHQVSQ